MEDVKWMFRKCGFPILIFLFVVIVGTVCWEKLKTEKPQSVAEEVWEPPVEIENSEEVSVEETDTESSMESVYWFVPQSEECLITDEEKKELQSMVLSAAESVSEIYVDIVISDAPNYSSGISDFTSEQRKVVVEHLGSKGLVSVEEDTNMQNYEKIETFYAEYLDGHDSMVTVFDVHRDGLLGAVTFIYRKNKLQTYYIGVRYIMEPEYVSQQELKQENTMQQVEDAKDTESWTVDQSDGTMYFFLDENNGWRLVITDAAAGSRFYVMEKTMDGGSTWECINDDPFSGQLGVAEGLIFYDENFGVAGITGASQSYSRLYVTRDGGRAFEEMKLPMDLVSELPQIAIDCGFTVEDFDYLNMPEKEDDTLTITVTTDAAEKDGIVFQSTDYGATWEYKGLFQIAN